MAGLQLADCAISCQDRFLDHQSICNYNAVFNSRLTRCVQTTCPSLEDVLQWQTHYASGCNLPARDQGVREVVLAYVLFGVATVSVAGRLLSRSKAMKGPGFWWDDWLVMGLWVLSIELIICLVFLRGNWAGRDAIDWVTRKHIEHVLFWVYVSEPFYIVATFGTKLVWVLLYMRMWDSNTAFRKLCWITASLLGAAMIGFGVGAIATFWPHHYYIKNTAVVRTHRIGIDLIPAVLSIGVLNVAFDFWVLLLPIPKLLRLHGVSRQRRTGICLVFLLGFIVTACSIVRFTTILPLRNSTNATWDIGHFGTWSEIEVHLSMISCNLPTLAGLLHRLTWRYRRRNTGEEEEEDPRPMESVRTDTTKGETSTMTDELSNTDDGLYEDSNGRICLRQKSHKQPD